MPCDVPSPPCLLFFFQLFQVYRGPTHLRQGGEQRGVCLLRFQDRRQLRFQQKQVQELSLLPPCGMMAREDVMGCCCCRCPWGGIPLFPGMSNAARSTPESLSRSPFLLPHSGSPREPQVWRRLTLLVFEEYRSNDRACFYAGKRAQKEGYDSEGCGRKNRMADRDATTDANSASRSPAQLLPLHNRKQVANTIGYGTLKGNIVTT